MLLEAVVQRCSVKKVFLETESAKLRALRAKNVLVCQHTLRAYVLKCLRALCAYVLTCLRPVHAHVLTCQCVLYVYVLT